MNAWPRGSAAGTGTGWLTTPLGGAIATGRNTGGEARSSPTVPKTVLVNGPGTPRATNTAAPFAAVDRIVGVFPPNAQEHVRVQLAEALQGVIAQTLLPAASGNALVAAREILVTTNAVRALIREHRHAQILNLIQTGNSVGMQTLESDLARLVRAGSVSAEHATAFANRPDELTSLLGDRAARPAAGSTRSSGTVPAVSADPNRRAPPRR